METTKVEHPIKAIRRAAVPLVAFETADPAATIAGIKGALNGKLAEYALIEFDIVRGWLGTNAKGKAALQGYDPAAMSLPESLAMLASKDTKDVIGFIYQADKGLEAPDGAFCQGLWLLRDEWKKRRCTMVLLGPSITLPPVLASDVVVYREPMPDREVITAKVDDIVKQARVAGAKIAEDYPKSRVVDGLRGLGSVFDVEQTLSLSITGEGGIDVPGVWARKIERLRKTTGMEITLDNPAFDSLAGCVNVKSEISGFINGVDPVGCVVFQDEIEKAFGGAGTDTSGVSTNMLGQWLSFTQDYGVRGFLLAGIPGAGKTMTGRCAAGEAGVPFCKLSFADLKGRWVGQSEQQLRAALEACRALAGDASMLMIASANWVDLLTPDVLARFTMGTFFYDFPSEEERVVLWRMYMAKYGLPDQPIPASVGWVGREIEVACFRARQYKRSLIEVACNISPSYVSQRAKLNELRRSCSGRFLSADRPGLFEVSDSPVAVERTLKFD